MVRQAIGKWQERLEAGVGDPALSGLSVRKLVMILGWMLLVLQCASGSQELDLKVPCTAGPGRGELLAYAYRELLETSRFTTIKRIVRSPVLPIRLIGRYLIDKNVSEYHQFIRCRTARSTSFMLPRMFPCRRSPSASTSAPNPSASAISSAVRFERHVPTPQIPTANRLSTESGDGSLSMTV